MDAVSPDHKIVIPAGAVTEPGADHAIVLRQGDEGNAQSTRGRGGAGQENVVKSDAGHRERGTDLGPQVFEIGLAERVAVLVKEPPSANDRGVALARPLGGPAPAERARRWLAG